jgi:hypothetical protein
MDIRDIALAIAMMPPAAQVVMGSFIMSSFLLMSHLLARVISQAG